MDLLLLQLLNSFLSSTFSSHQALISTTFSSLKSLPLLKPLSLSFPFSSSLKSRNLRTVSTMARGTSQSQSSSSSNTRPGPVAGMAPRGSAAATAGMRRRRLGSSSSSSAGGSAGFNGGGTGSNVLRFYTDDAPGLKISPTVVLVMSLCFIGFVTALHVFGKLYRYRSGAPGA